MASVEPRARPASAERIPRDEDIDVFGLTHPGKVRRENQDHFLVAKLSKQLFVERTSLPADAPLPLDPERLASLSMVADGVGSTAGGEQASRLAVQAVSEYVARSTHAFFTSDPGEPDTFAQVLCDAALRCHAGLLERTERDGQRYATTLTLWLGLWPHAYLLQVGDSRCYLFRDGQLTQLSRDQTIAQHLVDEGVLSRADASTSPFANVLSSAIGGEEAAPVVTRVTRDWGTVVLLCSDGLTKHVPDERIAERLASATEVGSERVCRDLLQDALDGGGSDNITLVVGRTIGPADL